MNLSAAAPAFERADLVLEVNNIEVVYNKVVQVLRGLSLAVPRGQIVAPVSYTHLTLPTTPYV